jgi:CheY-like chemotaxis protein
MRILIVDDEQRRMSVYVDELRDHRHVIEIAPGVDSALAIIEDARIGIDLVIMDISMPPETTFTREETYGGTRTGIAFYERLRALRSSLPVIAFTNVADLAAREYFTAQDQRLCRFVRKADSLPFEFAEMIEAFAREASSDQ